MWSTGPAKRIFRSAGLFYEHVKEAGWNNFFRMGYKRIQLPKAQKFYIMVLTKRKGRKYAG